jgi:hypothetical protein
MIYLTYDSQSGYLSGWYHNAVHTDIPSPNLTVSEEEYSEIRHAMTQGKLCKVVEGMVTLEERPLVEISWDEIRATRDEKLTASDWTQLKDVPEDLSNQYASYRQELRDLPQIFTDPNEVVWPVAPDQK